MVMRVLLRLLRFDIIMDSKQLRNISSKKFFILLRNNCSASGQIFPSIPHNFWSYLQETLQFLSKRLKYVPRLVPIYCMSLLRLEDSIEGWRFRCAAFWEVIFLFFRPNQLAAVFYFHSVHGNWFFACTLFHAVQELQFSFMFLCIPDRHNLLLLVHILVEMKRPKCSESTTCLFSSSGFAKLSPAKKNETIWTNSQKLERTLWFHFPFGCSWCAFLCEKTSKQPNF